MKKYITFYIVPMLMLFIGSINVSAGNYVTRLNINDGSNQINYNSILIEEPDTAAGTKYGKFMFITEDENLEIFQDEKIDPVYSRSFEGDVLVGFPGTNKNLFLVDAPNGQTLYCLDTYFNEKFKHVFSDDIKGLAVDDEENNAFVLTDEPELKKMNLKTGETKWTISPPDGVDAMAYASTYQELILIDVSNTTKLYFYKADGDGTCFKTITLPDIKFMRLIPSGIVIVRSFERTHDDQLMKYDYDGKCLWSKDFDYLSIIGTLASKDGRIVVRGNDYIKILNTSGEENWNHNFSDDINSMVFSLTQDKLFVLTDDGPGDKESQIMAFDFSNGRKIWTTSLDKEYKALLCNNLYIYGIDSKNMTQGEIALICCLLVAPTIMALGAVVMGFFYFLMVCFCPVLI
jgi:outer membrane protein assembly factor BamB